jgi:hypothetical protein
MREELLDAFPAPSVRLILRGSFDSFRRGCDALYNSSLRIFFWNSKKTQQQQHLTVGFVLGRTASAAAVYFSFLLMVGWGLQAPS